MVKQLVEYTTAAGEKLYVEVEGPEQERVGEQAAVGGGFPFPPPPVQGGNFEDELKKALDAVEPAFTGIRDRLKSFEPKTIDLAFGLTLNVSAGPVWAFTAGASATLSITLHWETQGT